MRDSRMAWLLCCGSFLASAPPLSAGTYPTPAPAPFVIALAGTNDAPAQPHFAFDGHGNSIRVWSLGTFGPGKPLVTDVMGELVDAHGLARGAAFRVNTYPPSGEYTPAVAMNRRGRAVVAWQSLGQDGQESGIYAQIYTPAGARFGGEIKVSPVFPRQTAGQPAVGIDRAGNFVVAWWNVQASFVRLFDVHGVARGPEIRLSSAPMTSNPAVVMRPDGSFAVVWRSWQQTGAGAQIFGRYFDAAGTPLGPELQINQTLIPGDGTPVAAAMPDGGLMVAWDSLDLRHPELGGAVRARRLTATGAPLSAELTVSPPDSRVHWLPAVAADGFGNSAVSWDNCLISGNLVYDCGISVLFSDPTRTPDPTLWTIRDAQGDLFEATVAAQPGGFVVGFSASAGIYGLSFLFK
jgi:serralysin